MDRQGMEQRTLDFAIRVVKLTSSLPHEREADVIGRQLLRAGTSIGANYREASRASSRRQFVAILEIAQREAAETCYWLDLPAATGMVKATRLQPLTSECNELLSPLVASIRTAKKSNDSAPRKHQTS